ncbi:curli biogenesis system outer membrane secretion channel CsgG [Thermovibrio guaymasensis]|uniref:Curli biogenesis system outer membrane secretion channel CsgG n=1 Tax=Thermovibrio guaymasensis TaxID=240167 RepID=A0A420W6Z4_9BACT|nr:CsgG/HfaB family protein [Thermovibrio guaymasensis]RKQ61830.1 curli biogenesis system outer membrane secretion channel CsgG [Thermovibrio guaymasensis]
MSKFKFTAAFGLLVLLTSGCAYNSIAPSTPVSVKPPVVNEEPPAHSLLQFLPPPKELIPVAIYNFRDQTGQYKVYNNISTFSTAVTQGAASILIKAAYDSGWFLPLERESLADLLTERRIIRSSIEQELKKKGLKPKGDVLPPLKFAPIILTGGIIGYDTDVVTGGFGAKYFGVGGSTQLRRDRVTVYLRAIAAKTGEVLLTVTATKTLLSRELDVHAFKYVKWKRLFQLETGVTTNEPGLYALQGAIEKALYALIVEGMVKGYWQPKNPSDIYSPVVQKYFKWKTEELKKEEDNLRRILGRDFTEKELAQYLKRVKEERNLIQWYEKSKKNRK